MALTFQETQSIFAFGPIQTDFNTEVAATTSPKNYRQYVKEGYDHAEQTSANIGNEGYSTGSPYATTNRKGNHDVTFSGSERATFQSLGLRALDSFGNYATPTTVATGIYSHAFTLLNPHVASVLPSRPLVEKINESVAPANNVIDRKFRSMTVENIEFASGDNPDLKIATSWRGSGKKTTPSGVTFYGAGSQVKRDDELTENFIHSTMGALSLYPQAGLGGSVFNTDCSFRDVSIKIEEGLNTDIGYNGCGKFQDQNNPESGAVRGQMPVTKQMATVEFTLLFTPDVLANFDPETRMTVGSEFSMKFIYTGKLIDATNRHKATFAINRGIIETLSFPMVDGVRAVKIATKLLAVGDVMPLSLTLVTNVADFNTYVG